MQTTQKRSLLYLDDEKECLEVFWRMFDKEYDVRTVSTAAEAYRELRERPADIIISDQCMPEISGTEFLREVAALYPASFRIMLTGNAFVFDVLPEISSGIVNLFAVKPWMPSYMRQILERASMSFELRAKAQEA